ncbi:MAG TPA: stage II sporulation protein E [Candidatus Riflebacteria bacterium]|jgi:hypothetical protein|nr:stage II sporulation protein E [Candidatus Riflebacteria bacterium]
MTSNMTACFIEIGHYQKAKAGQHSFGDVILKRFIKEEDRRVVVLSDGMGSGIKANVLASLTASMALNFVCEHKSIAEAYELIYNILPECSERKMGYATFTIVDMAGDGTVSLITYDNPLPFVLRRGEMLELDWQSVELASTRYAGKSVSIAKFTPEMDDRLFAFSDGISQSGLGRTSEWGRDGAIAYSQKALRDCPAISARDLSEKIVNKAEMNDKSGLKDDASHLTVHFREPRRMLIATGAPANRERDFAFARRFAAATGSRVIAGGTTSELIARELELKFSETMISFNDGLPPISQLADVDLVSEGVMTLSRVERLLRGDEAAFRLQDGAAERMARLIFNADLVEFVVGTASNEFHYDFQYKMRVQLVKDIAELIENRHLKKVTVEYF